MNAHRIKLIDHTRGFDIGGGTPTALSDDNFRLLLQTYKDCTQRLNLSDDFEPSIEGTFDTLTQSNAKLIASVGIKRNPEQVTLYELRTNMICEHLLDSCELRPHQSEPQAVHPVFAEEMISATTPLRPYSLSYDSL